MFLPIKKDCLKSYHDFYKTVSLNVVSVQTLSRSPENYLYLYFEKSSQICAYLC